MKKKIIMLISILLLVVITIVIVNMLLKKYVFFCNRISSTQSEVILSKDVKNELLEFINNEEYNKYTEDFDKYGYNVYTVRIESFLSIITNKSLEVDYYITTSGYVIYESNENFYISKNNLNINEIINKIY